MRCPSLHELPSPPEGTTGWPWDQETPQLPDMMPGGNPWPLISIVSPSYNQELFIERTIRSVLLQGYPNIEYMIFDGGSTDQTVAIIRKYESWLSYWCSEPDRGQSHALNKGFAHTQGSLLTWLNTDDVYVPGALKVMAQAFEESDVNLGALVGNARVLIADGELLYIPKTPDLTFEGLTDWSMNTVTFIAQPACFFTQKAWEKCGPLDEELFFSFDLDLWIKISQHFDLKPIGHEIAYIFTHEAAKTTAQSERMIAEGISLLWRHGAVGSATRALYELAYALRDTRRQVVDLQRHSILWRSHNFLRTHPIRKKLAPLMWWCKQKPVKPDFE